MAFEADRLKAIGGQDNTDYGGDLYSYTPSGSDGITEIIAGSYFDDAWESLNVGDCIIAVTSEGYEMLKVTARAESDVTVVSGYKGQALTQSLSGAGAVDIVSEITLVTTTGADALTIADGAYIGQRKTIIMVVDGGDGTLTPSNGLGYSTITFADAGDGVELVWTSGGWATVGAAGLTAGPVIA